MEGAADSRVLSGKQPDCRKREDMNHVFEGQKCRIKRD